MKRSPSKTQTKKKAASRVKKTDISQGKQPETGEHPELVDRVKHQNSPGNLRSSGLSRCDVLQLQRVYGNQFVQRILSSSGEESSRLDFLTLQRQEEDEQSSTSGVAGHSGVGVAATTTQNTSQEHPADHKKAGDTGQSPNVKKAGQSTGSGSTASTVSDAMQQATGSTPEKTNGNGPVTQGAPGAEQQENQALEGTTEAEGDGTGKKSGAEQAGQAETELKESQQGAGPVQEQEPQAAQSSQAAGMGAGPGSTAQAEGPAIQGQSPQSPQADPDFQKTIEQVKGAAQQEKSHPPAAEKAKEAQEAAEAPASEVEARAQANQTKEMETAPVPPFDAAGFKAKLMQRLQALTPRTAEQAEQFKASNKVGSLKAELKSKVEQERKKSKDPLEKKTSESPKTGSIPPKQVKPLPELQAGPKPTIPTVGQAVPKPKNQAEIEIPLREKSKTLDSQMAEAEITEEQLRNSNEPEFESALKRKKEAQKEVEKAPPAYREEEKEEIAEAKTDATSVAESGVEEMHGNREQIINQVGNEQVGTKGADEKQREKIAADIQAIFTETKTNVTGLLSQLDGQVDQVFSNGAEKAKSKFENFVENKMKAFKQARYSGPMGWLKWAKDKLLGMPPEVNAFYSQGRDLYIQQMDVVIDTVIEIIGETLAQAKEEIATGREKIANYIALLPTELQAVGQQAAEQMSQKLDQLEVQVNETQGNLIDHLADSYNRHLQNIDAKIVGLKNESEGLLGKAFDAVKSVVNTIIKLRDQLLSILSKAASAVKKIIKDPIGFVGNLFNAVSTGLTQFMTNIKTHISKGLINWLVKALSEIGVEPPESLDLKGLFGMAMKLLGITWQTIRERATSVLGEGVVSRLENVFDIFAVLKSKGPSGLWELFGDQLAGIKENILGPIQDFIIQDVITGGIEKILGLLGASPTTFTKAVNKITKVVSWFMGKGQQVGSLVGAIMKSITGIASGVVGQAAQFIENALAKSIPGAINFLAKLLGIGGLADKIKNIILKIKQPIDRVITRILKKATGLAAKISGAMDSG